MPRKIKYDNRVEYRNDNNQFHRLDGPAREWSNGSKHWYVDGKLHRLDGPAVEWSNGSKEWHVNGELHRENGPAVEGLDGYCLWVKNGKLHRLDGPAVEWSPTTTIGCEYYINGLPFSFNEYNKLRFYYIYLEDLKNTKIDA